MASSPPSIEVMLAQVQKYLGRKASFEDGVKLLTTIIEERYSSALPEQQKEVFSSVRRVGTLLQSRYTSRGFWLAGLKLFMATQDIVSSQLEKRQLNTFIEQAKEITQERAEEDQESHAPGGTASLQSGGRGTTPFLFEGQLSAGATPSRPPWLVAQTSQFSVLSELHSEHFNDAEQGNTGSSNRDVRAREANIDQQNSRSDVILGRRETHEGLNRLEEGQRNRGTAVPPAGERDTNQGPHQESPASGSGTAHTASTQPEADNASGLDGYTDEASQERALAALSRLRRMLEALRGPEEGGRVPDYLEVMRAAMMHAQGDDIPALQEALEASMQSAPQGPPPASKKAVAALVRKKVTAEMVANMEHGTQCIVCREASVEEDVMLVLPCNHWFHTDCILPWLNLHNSCPLCRFEMPTDDVEYERQKERDMEEREERRGVENALQENQHMFM